MADTAGTIMLIVGLLIGLSVGIFIGQRGTEYYMKRDFISGDCKLINSEVYCR